MNRREFLKLFVLSAAAGTTAITLDRKRSQPKPTNNESGTLTLESFNGTTPLEVRHDDSLSMEVNHEAAIGYRDIFNGNIQPLRVIFTDFDIGPTSGPDLPPPSNPEARGHLGVNYDHGNIQARYRLSAEINRGFHRTTILGMACSVAPPPNHPANYHAAINMSKILIATSCYLWDCQSNPSDPIPTIDAEILGKYKDIADYFTTIYGPLVTVFKSPKYLSA